MEVQLRTAYRQLKRRHEPKTAGTKRALLKSIVNNQQAKKLQKVDGNLTREEGLFKRYECIETDKLPERVKVTLITGPLSQRAAGALGAQHKGCWLEICSGGDRQSCGAQTGPPWTWWVKAMEVDYVKMPLAGKIFWQCPNCNST